ncbi:MAG: ABC transporter permease [candidate division Zixibacteria bacterium]|nr:ABC transporter permease [candidate division Zixibacteria bacterium]
MNITTGQGGLWRDARRRFIKNKLSLVAAVIISILIVMAIFAPWMTPYHYSEANFDDAWKFPSWKHPMGTDSIGRDYFSRILYGARISLIVGLVAQMLSLFIGVPLGAIAGYRGGRADFFVMRLVDVMSVFPGLLFAILIMAWLGSGFSNVLIAIGVTGWVGVCRLVRAQFLSLRESDFVRAARSIGASHTHIIVRHLLPNAISPIIVGLAMGIPAAIFAEAGLSFLGLGINPPTPSWGQMVSSHLPNVIYYWHLALFPVFMIAITMLGFSLVGDGLRDALDPKMNE